MTASIHDEDWNDATIAWADSDVLEGLDITDKSALVDVPFRILGCQFQKNKDNVDIAYIDAERTDGRKFMFLDSSTGAKTQLVDYLKRKELDYAIESGEYVEFKLVIPSGLRFSDYEVPVKSPNGTPIPGKVRKARTYYLTTNGVRQVAVNAAEATKLPRAARTPKA